MTTRQLGNPRGRLRLAAFATFVLFASPPVGAQEVEEATPPSAPEVPKGPADEFGRGIPRGAMLGYLEAARTADFVRAAAYLDLRRLSRDSRDHRGPVLARQLKVVLDKELWVELETLSAEPDGLGGDGLPAYRDRVGTIQTSKGPVDILVQRVPREDGVRIWKISSATVAEIPALWNEFGDGPIEALLPDWLVDLHVLEVSLWQWAALMTLMVLVFGVSWFLASGLFAVARPLVARSVTDLDDRILKAVLGPFRVFVGVFLLHVGASPLGLAVPVRRFILGLEVALAFVALTWLFFRLIDIFALIIEKRFQVRDNPSAVTFIPLGVRTLKFVLGTLTLLVALDNLTPFDVTALIAGLGVGGIAVALAAQKTLENIFGGVTIIADQPVRPGDFCRFGDKIGTVEQVGLRSTRVRTLDRTIVTIPNAEFSVLQLENFRERDMIWYHPKLGLRYETTPDQIRYILVEIRRMLYAHPKVSSAPARIRFVGFGDSSLDLEIFAYVLTGDYNQYLEVAEDLNLRIMDIVEQAGSGFAFPSSTLYVARDDGLDDTKARAAEAQVQAWKEQGELSIPDFRPEEIDRLRASIPYPTEGSALAPSPRPAPDSKGDDD